ncbi:methyltransferase [Fusarium fujikuroi]|nr:methyltransferase [Fusarium fujikuroi]
MSSPARKKRADLGSSGSTSPRVDAESGLLPPEYWSQLPEEESAPGDEDSAVLDNASSTASLTSSILQYRTINGRAYQSERGNPEYWGPIDDTGQEAMDINHHVLTLLLGDKLYLAPVPEDIQTAVDIGTGTGIWAMEFADKFSNASVIGTDLAPIQPGWIPPNLEFQIEDCTQEWTFQPNTFDYIHM